MGEDIILISKQLGEHDARIKNLEVCIDKINRNEQRLSELELNQKLITNNLIEIKAEVSQNRKDLNTYISTAQNTNRLLLWGFIGILITLVFTSVTLYSKNSEKMYDQFQAVYRELNTVKEQLYQLKNISSQSGIK